MGIDSTGAIYVTGYSAGTNGQTDYATIKYDAAGNRQWVRRYNGSNGNGAVATALAVDATGNVYVTGQSFGQLNGNSITDFATIKYDTNGNQVWRSNYIAPRRYDNYVWAIGVDGAGAVYIAGSTPMTQSNGTSGEDFVTVKYDAMGHRKWARFFEGPLTYSEPRGMAVDSAGNVYVTGSSQSSGLIGLTVKYDTDGRQKWARRYGDGVNTLAGLRAVTLDTAGNVFVSGAVYLSRATENDYLTLEYDSLGNPTGLRSKRYNGTASGDDFALATAADSMGNVYVTGSSDGGSIYQGGTGNNAVTIKYVP
jgi:hypothetical protein